jgi:hypothetical protein
VERNSRARRLLDKCAGNSTERCQVIENKRKCARKRRLRLRRCRSTLE